MKLISTIANELKLREKQVAAVSGLLAEGATIPFIARYRKEKTGSLDEVAITAVRDRLAALEELGRRKDSILKSLLERSLLTPELEKAIEKADAMAVLEDVYEKYRPKRRTRAMAAKEKGLAPLADFILAQGKGDPAVEAGRYVHPDKGVETAGDALSGARDIIAEAVNEDPGVRAAVRRLFETAGLIRTTVKPAKKADGSKFRDYFDWSEPAFKAPSHRILAMLRGAGEGILTLHVLPDEADALNCIERRYVKPKPSPGREQVKAAVRESYKRLLSKSLEKECLKTLKLRADREAVAVFAKNLKALLLAPPLGEKNVLAVDPGFRTGCKLACLDRSGQLLHHGVIHPHKGEKDRGLAGKTVLDLVKTYEIEAVAVGNGTAGRETETFIRNLDLPADVAVVLTDESGASIYSASDIARQEFPDQDITVRGAVSIGRRLMDPLAELVKIDPKSIGVGQYQHDVDQKLLQASLEETVQACVNQVGVEANTASAPLLARVSGLNAVVADNFVRYRQKNGPFKTRKDFLKVPRLGPKGFEQAAGFLRIRKGKNPLDGSGIHPESYGVVERMARAEGVGVKDLIRNAQRVRQIDLKAYADETVGLPTLTDIAAELCSPGLDPRESFQIFAFDTSVHDITDLSPGMVLPGIVTNVTAFGAFVDVGVHQDGLVHISQLADRFVKDPGEIVTVRQKVKVRVLDVDTGRRRISLSMKPGPGE